MIGWNVDELKNVLTGLLKQKDELIKNRDILLNLKNSSNLYLEGLAGEELKSRIDIKIKEFDNVINELEDNIEGLNNVSREYENAETDIRARIRLTEEL